MATAAEKAAAKAAQAQAAAEKAAGEAAAKAEAAAAQAKADAENALASDIEDTGEKFAAVCLRDCEFGKAGELVEISAREINVGKAQGAIDDHPDAVDYVRSLKGE